MNQQSVSYPTPRPLLFRVHGSGFRCTRHVSLQRCHDMASPSLHGVPRVVPPLQRYYGTLRLPAVRLDPFEFFTSRYHRVARGLLPSVVGVPPGARELSVPVSPSGFTMETLGSLRFLGNPGGHCPCSSVSNSERGYHVFSDVGTKLEFVGFNEAVHVRVATDIFSRIGLTRCLSDPYIP